MEQGEDGTRTLTDKQRYWLERIQTAEREDLSPRIYAERHGLRVLDCAPNGKAGYILCGREAAPVDGAWDVRC